MGRSTDEDGTTIHVVRGGGAPQEIYRHRESAGVGDLSHDGTLIAIEHTEHGDAMHSALRVVRPDGTTVAELDDTEGGSQELGLEVLGFAPVDGDTRLLVGHQRRGRWEPMVWDVASGEETDLALDLPGDVSAEWYPDGSALLVVHSFEARSDLWRYEFGSGALTRVETPPGTVSGATARPDGTVEYLWSSAAAAAGRPVHVGRRRPRSARAQGAGVRAGGGRVGRGARRPHPRPRPEAGGGARGRCPTVFEVHGGPDLARQRRVRGRTRRPGSTTASRWSGSTTGARPDTGGSGRTRSSTASA